jgi:hypothetical protein
MKMIAYTKFNSIKCLFTLLLAMTASGLFAQVKLSVQGLVKKSDGTSLTDNFYDLKFRFYDAESGGTLLATETVNTEINGGVYSAILGSAGGLDMLPFDKPYFVSVAVNNGAELLPRIALSAAPYAISLQGANNKFPSTGTVKADALDVTGAVSAGVVRGSYMTADGGAPAGVVAGKGYSFGAGGDADGGLFSLGDNNVALYANATKVLESSNTFMNIPISLQVAGNESVTGTFSAGAVFSESNVIAKGTSNNGGFTFQNEPGYDTGLFSNGPGECQLRTNGISRIWLGNNLDISNNANVYVNASGDVQLAGSGNGSNSSFAVGGAIVMNLGAANGGAGYLYINGMKPKGNTGNPRNLAIDMSNGRVFEESSSRRYKTNIRPLQDNFDLLLKVEPRIYNRFEDPVDIDTSKYFEIGYIAEEIDSIGLRKLVQYSNEGQIDGVDYTKMILYAVEVLKTQHADIENLKAEVAALTAEKNALRTENTGLRADAQNRQADFGKQLDEVYRRLKSLETTASNR